MIGLATDSCVGTLTIDGINLCTSAWLFPDLRTLWLPATVRGTDLVMAQAIGVRARRRRRTVTTHDLPFLISGEVDLSGTPASPFTILGIQQQLETNVAYLRSNVIDPTNATDGTRAATLTMPSGATRSAAVHVTNLTIAKAMPRILSCLFTISIPAGVFA